MAEVSAAEFRRISIENRRKQLAECHWLRARATEHLAAGDSLIVLGDFNDGPGIDQYEKVFGKSGVEVVHGPDRPARPAPDRPPRPDGPDPTSACTPPPPASGSPPAQCYFEALLDFIMVSPDLAAKAPELAHLAPLQRPQDHRRTRLRDAILTASDHFPVTLDL